MPFQRRTACLECVRTKKKCSQELPQCQRCQNRLLDCEYPSPHDEQLPQVVASAELSLIPTMDSFLLDSIYPYASSPLLTWGDQLELDEFMALQLPPHVQPAEPGMRQMSMEEMSFCVAQFVEYPTLWLQSGAGPFIHPGLHDAGLPAALQAAYSAAAVYTTMTPQNSAAAWSVIESLAGSILTQTSLTASVETTAQLLARVQALCIFQIIRLFSPDMHQRRLAELAEPVLSDWTDSLMARTAADRGICAGDSRSWRSWIFSETVRRTVIMSFMIRGVYSLVKCGHCTLAPAVTALSFTAQKSLWNTKNAREWHDVRRCRDEYWIENMRFENLVNGAAKHDIEEMGVLMSVTYCGRAHVEQWLTQAA